MRSGAVTPGHIIKGEAAKNCRQPCARQILANKSWVEVSHGAVGCQDLSQPLSNTKPILDSLAVQDLG